jgi:hypothetical protein
MKLKEHLATLIEETTGHTITDSASDKLAAECKKIALAYDEWLSDKYMQIAELDRAVAVKEWEYGAKVVKMDSSKQTGYILNGHCLIIKMPTP